MSIVGRVIDKEGDTKYCIDSLFGTEYCLIPFEETIPYVYNTIPDKVPVYATSKMESMDSLVNHIYSNKQLRVTMGIFEMYKPRFYSSNLNQNLHLIIECRSTKYFNSTNYEEDGYENLEFTGSAWAIEDFLKVYPNIPRESIWVDGSDNCHIFITIDCTGFTLERIS